MIKIAQIIPYFGKWPEWFELYLYSCGKNPVMDFIFYTDCPVPEKIYPNTHFVSISADEYCKLVGERLGIDYSIKNPYKLTDLKPFLGAVHEPELNGYDYWSFGDIDLVYGDLSSVLSKDNLEKYDVLTTHNYHIAGHLTVLKNNDYYRDLCFKIADWQKRLCDEKHYAFDEGEWSKLVFPALFINRCVWKYLVSKLKIVDFFNFMDFANRIDGGRRLFKEFFTSPAPKPGEEWIYTKDGRVFDPQGRELPYIHFLFFKKTPWFETENYWRAGFYKLADDGPVDFNAIKISLDGIEKNNE